MKAVRCNMCFRDFKTEKASHKIKCPHCDSNESFSVRELLIRWDGNVLKKLIKDNKFKKVTIALCLCVSRQTIDNWIKGACPIGTHLIGLSKYFNVSPGVFFGEENQP